jgi:prolyl-tRNA synthetase
LSIARGIEIGHVFQLGKKFADAFSLDVLGPEGKPVRVTMGSYGIGVSRAVAAIAEQSHDDSGLIWPRSIAPADVHVVIAGQGEQKEGGLALAESLEAAGLRVLLDDRHKVSPGVAFKDAELIGVPTYVVVGKNLATDGTIEIRDRRSGSSRTVAVADAVTEIVSEVRG